MTTFGNVAIACRMGGPPHPKFVQSWTNLVWLGLRQGDKVMAPLIRMPAHRAANRAVDAFLTEEPLAECDSLLFVDDDHVFGWDTLSRLRDNKELQRYDMVGALYAARGPMDKNFPVILRRRVCASCDGSGTRPQTMPHNAGCGEQSPLAGKVVDRDCGACDGRGHQTCDKGNPQYDIPTHMPQRHPVACDAMGLGFTLIRRSVLERVRDAHGACFEYREPTTTEDVVFCERAIDSGATLAVWPELRIGHLMDMVVMPKIGKPQTEGE